MEGERGFRFSRTSLFPTDLIITGLPRYYFRNCSYDKIHRRFPGERRFRVVLRHESSNTTTTAGSTSLQSEEHVTPLELAKRMDGIYRALLRNGGEPLGQPGGNGMKRIRHELPRCPR